CVFGAYGAAVRGSIAPWMSRSPRAMGTLSVTMWGDLVVTARHGRRVRYSASGSRSLSSAFERARTTNTSGARMNASTTRLRAALAATALALVTAAPLGAQAWAYPSFQVPRVTSREFNFGIADAD